MSEDAPRLHWIRERAVKKTRTVHTCYLCRREIPAGSQAVYHVLMTDEDTRPDSGYRHTLYVECVGRDDVEPDPWMT